jgi:NAD(P)-dependent dehydrogenase (short-subunit alcohol dehydrogenase family)
MAGKLDGKVAIVTGGSSGIGRATAVTFAKEGAKVVIAARRTQEGEETVRLVQEAGSEALFVQTDVTNAAQIEALVNKTVEIYGRLDCAFNNAGFGKSIPLTQRTEEDWDSEIDVNLKAVWLCLKYEIPAMQRTGGGAIALCGIYGRWCYRCTRSFCLQCSQRWNCWANSFSCTRIC